MFTACHCRADCHSSSAILMIGILTAADFLHKQLNKKIRSTKAFINIMPIQHSPISTGGHHSYLLFTIIHFHSTSSFIFHSLLQLSWPISYILAWIIHPGNRNTVQKSFREVYHNSGSYRDEGYCTASISSARIKYWIYLSKGGPTNTIKRTRVCNVLKAATSWLSFKSQNTFF